jgi:alpha-acetolactate decarboxylase
MRFVPAILLLVAGCAARVPATGRAAGWHGEVRTWGTMRAVMREQRQEGRVDLESAVEGSSSFGIGALAQLQGEIVILDGVVWTSRVRAGKQVETREGLVPGDRSTLLAACEVERWSEEPIGAAADLAALEESIASALERRGLGEVETVPFVIEGELGGLDAHVLDGACPYTGPLAEEDEPAREHRAESEGTLVGFFTHLPPGTLTHHGSRVHVHALLRGEVPFVGHVDAVALPAGARLRLPLGT